MESQTQTITVPEASSAVSTTAPEASSAVVATVPAVSSAGDPANGTGTNSDSNGERHTLRADNLPEPKTAPPGVEEPEARETLLDRMASDEEMEENNRLWDIYNETEWAQHVAFKNEVESVTAQGFLKPGDDEEGKEGSRNIFAGESFSNGHQVNAYLLEQLCMVLETAADSKKRSEGFSYLSSVVSKEKSLQKEWDHNLLSMEKWAKSGYPGVFKPTFLDKEGKEILGENGQPIHSPPNVIDEYWTKRKLGKEAAPEQSKVIRLPPMKAMDDIRAEAATILGVMVQDPEKIRGEGGKRLGTLNDTINRISADYVADYNSRKETEDEKIGSLIEQRVPDIRIIQMIVISVEQMVLTGKDDIDGIPEVMGEYNNLKVAIDRAGHPSEWFDWIAIIAKQKLESAKDFKNQNPGRDYHEQEGLWRSDLATWLAEQVNTNGQYTSSTTRFPRIESEDPASNQQPSSSVGPVLEHATSSEPRSEVGMEDAPTNVASTGQSPSLESAAASLPSETSSRSVPTQTVRYQGMQRPIGGVRSTGPNRYQYLVQVNDVEAVNPFWHVVASGKLTGDAGKYLEEGGYLVKATESTKTEEKNNSVEGDIKDLKGKRLCDFSMKGIAVIPRETGKGYINATMHIVQGHLTAEGPEKSRFYTISILAKAFKKRREAIQEAIEEHMEKNDFTLQAKPLECHTRKRRPGKRSNKDESESEGEDVEHVSDGPLDQNDGVYSTTDPFGFVVPEPPADSPTSNSAGNTRSHETGKMRAEIMASVDKKLDFLDAKLEVKMDQLMAMIQASTVGSTPKSG